MVQLLDNQQALPPSSPIRAASPSCLAKYQMVLLCSPPPAPLPVDVAATRPLVQTLATSVAARAQRLWPRAVPLPLDPRDYIPKSADGKQDTKVVLIRQVPTRMTGQRKTGYLLWGAAFVLARWVHLHRDLFAGKSVIEVGSGLGLGGITAARYATRTVLTDYQSDTCTALEYNAQLNRPFTHEFEPAKPEIRVSHLDWDVMETIEAVPKADVLIASDIICEPSTAEGFLRVVRHHVLGHASGEGVAYLMNANSHSRFGVIHLHALLAASPDLSYSITPVQKLPDGAQLLETVSDAQELSYEFYEIRAAAHKGNNA
ncbi:hypothetical protein BBJ28_00001278 [Nothophytophthora sp. Chile5]|nr:hypothetical protein BBJ28_00001278 [Nothophytophthora sp. Chile5]